jgi:hypothetical protein
MTKSRDRDIRRCERIARYLYRKLIDASVPILKPIAAAKWRVRLGGVVHELALLIPPNELTTYLRTNALPFGKDAACDYWGCWYLHRYGWDLPTIANKKAWEIDREVLKLLPR